MTMTIATTPICAATDAICVGSIFMDYPVPLCRHHALQVSLHVTDVLYATARAGDCIVTGDGESAELIQSSAPVNLSVWQHQSHPALVYFLTNGNRVKIGTSTNIRGRVGALAFRKSDILLLLAGGPNLESALHSEFASDRIASTEWFVLSARVSDFIKGKNRGLTAATGHRAPSVLPMRQVSDGAVSRRRLVPLLEEAGRDGLTATELQEALGVSKKTTYQHLGHHQGEGTVGKLNTRPVRYALTRFHTESGE